MIFISHNSIGQSFYLGKTMEFIIKEKGPDYKTDYETDKTVVTYKIVNQRGEESSVVYFFSNAKKCFTIIEDHPLFIIFLFTDELNKKYKRLDKNNWLEKDNILHNVSVINETTWMHIIKYED